MKPVLSESPRRARVDPRMMLLLASFLVLASFTLGAVRAPAASAQTTYTIPVTYGGLGYGALGYGGLGYGLGYGDGSYGLGTTGYPFGYNYGYNSYTPSYAFTPTYTPTSTGGGIAVGVSWTFCTGSNGPVWVAAGRSMAGLLC